MFIHCIPDIWRLQMFFTEFGCMASSLVMVLLWLETLVFALLQQQFVYLCAGTCSLIIFWDLMRDLLWTNIHQSNLTVRTSGSYFHTEPNSQDTPSGSYFHTEATSYVIGIFEVYMINIWIQCELTQDPLLTWKIEHFPTPCISWVHASISVQRLRFYIFIWWFA